MDSVSTEEYHFTADGELTTMNQYSNDEDQDGRAEEDIMDKFVIDNSSQVFETTDSNTYVTEAIDDSSQGEQFLTIPRGRTQITVCDNGNIVYTEDAMLGTTSQVEESGNDDEGETVYYQTEQDSVEANDEPMEVENVTATKQYMHHIEDASFVTESDEGNFTEVGVDEQELQARAIAETVLSKSDMKQFIALQQETSRGVKRNIPSTPDKNPVTKVFLQGSPSTSSGQPITIIGSLPGSVMGTRTLTMAQAQRLGLFSSGGKIQLTSNVSSPGGRMVVKKIVPTSGSSVLAIKSPTKILPAPSSNKARLPVVGSRSSSGNIMPIRTNIPVSQLKMLTAMSSNSTQVRPVAVPKGSLNITTSKSPQKMYVRPSTSVLSPLAGQLARIGPNATFQPIQIKGKQSIQYVKLVSPGNAPPQSGMKPKFVKTITSRSVSIAPSPVATKTATLVGNKIILPVSSPDGDKLVQLKTPPSIVPTKSKTFTVVRSSSSFSEEVVVPEEEKSETQEEIEELCDKENVEAAHSESVLEANGIRPKKPCNCTKSQCLKLYCECFANGEFCFQCNCNNCFNNIEHEEERQQSIQSCLERNPSAFRPKFQIRESEEEDRRNKGCNCRRSGCFKNYCECFEAKIPCSKICKCQGCKNTEEEMEAYKTRGDEPQNGSGGKTPMFMSATLAEALCHCMLAQAEKAENNGDDVETTERRIIEEFGQCIVQIIGNRNKKDLR